MNEDKKITPLNPDTVLMIVHSASDTEDARYKLYNYLQDFDAQFFSITDSDAQAFVEQHMIDEYEKYQRKNAKKVSKAIVKRRSKQVNEKELEIPRDVKRLESFYLVLISILLVLLMITFYMPILKAIKTDINNNQNVSLLSPYQEANVIVLLGSGEETKQKEACHLLKEYSLQNLYLANAKNELYDFCKTLKVEIKNNEKQ